MRLGTQRTTAIVLGIVLSWCVYGLALDPSLDVTQYAHTVWKPSEGFSKGVIFSVTQTPDGYLWLGTEFGLLRFDGVRAVPWQAPAGERLPNSEVRSVRAARDGRLWIGTFRGLASYKDGKLTHYPELDDQVIEALLEDREGTIWVGGSARNFGRLCSIQSDKTQCYGEDGRFGSGITAVYEDKRGNLWAAGTTGLWRWKPGPPKLYRIADPGDLIYALTDSEDAGILAAKHSGIIKLRNGKTEAYHLPAGAQFKPQRLFRDRDGALWVGAVVDKGLMHIHEGRTDLFTREDGLSGGAVSSLFEDSEGNIWVATVDGLDRFRELAVPTYSVRQGLSSQGVAAVLAATDGSIWLGTSDGVNRLDKGRVTIYRKPTLQGRRNRRPVGTLAAGGPATAMIREVTDTGLPANSVGSLFEDDLRQIWVATDSGVAIFKSDRFIPVRAIPRGMVLSIAGDSVGNVWLSHPEGLFRLVQGRLVERIPWAKLGRTEPASALMHDPEQGGLWLGFRDEGVAYFQGGQIRVSYGTAKGVAEGGVHSLYLDGDNTLWAATEAGLSRIKDGRVRTLTTQNGLPCNTVHWLMDDNAQSAWLYMACGLVRIARPELDAWVSNAKQTIQAAVFDTSDGVSNHRFNAGYSTIVAKSADGKIWFLPFGGISVVDPQHVPFNHLPPPVHIEQVTADGKPQGERNGMHLPAGVRDVAIDYTAVSLVVPEKVRFRYKLEGQDNDWREAVNREVQYSNLSPQHYRFRVIACNNSGVWNAEGASLDFVIPPMWYQTNWFYALCAAGFLAFLWAAYQLRVRQLAAQFNMRLEERVAERTRIARDLHDTLLQSFQALLLRFQAGINLLSKRPDDGRKLLEDALEHASQAITEGRDAISGLRMSTVERNDLTVAIKTVAEELAAAQSNNATTPFHVLVEGTPRELHAILRDEIYRLATEALRNAFQHAAAQKIEVEIRYDQKYFRLRVRDDGRGIPPDVLSGDGREGHYGLNGMRERAKLVGSKLTIWTELGSGTEIELVIPGARAYVKPARPFWHFRKRSATEAHDKETTKRE